MLARSGHHFTNKIVKIFLNSNLSLILILLATILGFAALWLTPREEDPQIVVPLADIYVNFPGHSAGEVEQLIATPLEKILYQIDGVEFVYSMSREGQAISPFGIMSARIANGASSSSTKRSTKTWTRCRPA